jgi:hypothetical protein
MDTYVMNMIVPSDQRDYCILADFIGVVGNLQFNDETSFYDIDHIWKSQDSNETLTGHRMFVLTPTRVYYWDAGYGVTTSNSKYTTNDIDSALTIVTNNH